MTENASRIRILDGKPPSLSLQGTYDWGEAEDEASVDDALACGLILKGGDEHGGPLDYLAWTTLRTENMDGLVQRCEAAFNEERPMLLECPSANRPDITVEVPIVSYQVEDETVLHTLLQIPPFLLPEFDLD